MIESEAKEKWCPFVQINVGVATKNSYRERDGFRCLASDCMAWRWNEVEDSDYPSKVHGYCGLAGKE